MNLNTLDPIVFSKDFYNLSYESRDIDFEKLKNYYLDFIVYSKRNSKWKVSFLTNLRKLCKNKQNQDTFFSIFEPSISIDEFSMKRINKILKTGTNPPISFHGDSTSALSYLIDFKLHFFLSHIYSLAYLSEKIFGRKFESFITLFDACNSRSILGKQFIIEDNDKYFFKMKEVNCSMFMLWSSNTLYSLDSYINNYYNARIVYSNYFIANLSYLSSPSETQKELLKHSSFGLSDICSNYNSIEKVREIISENVTYICHFNHIETDKYDSDDLYVLSLLSLESTCGNSQPVFSFINYYLSSSDYVSYPRLKDEIVSNILFSCFKKNGFKSFLNSISFYDNYFNIIFESNLDLLKNILTNKKINETSFKKTLTFIGVKNEDHVENLYSHFSNLNSAKVFLLNINNKETKDFYNSLFISLYNERYYNTLMLSVNNGLSPNNILEELSKINKDIDKKQTMSTINKAIEDKRLSHMSKYNLSTRKT